MEIEEIIDVLRVCADDETICPACPHYDTGAYGSGTAACYQNLMLEAADVIESQQKRIAELEAALREQEERDNRLESDAVKNEPLTLDELRGMVGEPVWVKLFDTGEEFWVLRYEWVDTRNPEPMMLFHMRWYAQADYGKTWLAYRSKPKEDAK